MPDSLGGDLRIVGGHVALDLINTVAPRLPGGGSCHDFVTTPADLLAWSTRAGVVDDEEARAIAVSWRRSRGAAAGALHATASVREATHGVLVARIPTAGGAGLDPYPSLDLLGKQWAAATARSGLVVDAHRPSAAHVRVGGDPAHLIPDRLAFAAVEILTTVDLSHVGVCPVAEGGCGWMFLDHSRNRSRRWCAMADCGTRAKARRLTDRRRDRRRRAS